MVVMLAVVDDDIWHPQGRVFFDDRWNVVPICVNLVWHIVVQYMHR